MSCQRAGTRPADTVTWSGVSGLTRSGETPGTARRRGQARLRRGQSLVEFALVALVLYLLLAGILTFGHAIFVAQGLQQAADVAAREISRLPLPPAATFDDALLEAAKDTEHIFSKDFLVYDLAQLAVGESFFADVVPTWPIVNQQLAPLMIVDRPDFNGDGVPDARLIRYPGALLSDPATPSGYTVAIPLVVNRPADGGEAIMWVPVVQEIRPSNGLGPFPVSSSGEGNEGTGIVALRINYPFQSASMSSFRRTAEAPFEPNIGNPNAADDSLVTELNPTDRPGDLLEAPLESGGIYAGTYGGRYGLGAQGALGSQALTGGRPVRPYRRLITAQAIYRREVFSSGEVASPDP